MDEPPAAALFEAGEAAVRRARAAHASLGGISRRDEALPEEMTSPHRLLLSETFQSFSCTDGRRQ